MTKTVDESNSARVLVGCKPTILAVRVDTHTYMACGLYHVAIPTDVSLLSLSSRRQSRAAGLQRMTTCGYVKNFAKIFQARFHRLKLKIERNPISKSLT